MVVTVFKKMKGKELVLTAADSRDRRVLEEIIEIEAHAEVKRDPYTKVIIEISLPLVSK